MRWPPWGGKHYPNPVGNLGGEIVPDRISTEPIEAYRSWHVVTANDGLYALRSLHMPHIWENPETARCYPQGYNRVTHRPGDSPHPECACGLYGELPDHPFTEWEPMRVGKVSVFGTVALYGRVVICERGYKAQHARILSGHFEVSCAKGGCMNPVVVVEPTLNGPVLCWCTTHSDQKESVVDSETWIREAARQLTARYSTEFVYWP